MAGLFDRLGKAAQQTAAEGRIRLEIHNLTTQLDQQAQALGHLMFRQHKGETIPDEEYVKILDEMTRLNSERQAKEVELEDLKRPSQPPAPAPAPAPAPEPAAQAPAALACRSCGAALNPGARFCPNCGTPVAAQ